MESQSKSISEPSTSQNPADSPTASKTDDSGRQQEREDTHTMQSPSYRPPGYPQFGNLWTQPPTALPGPDDHPFFKWVAEGAKKDPAVMATNRPPPIAHQAALPTRPLISAHSITQPQMVYPFVPGPTVVMEPYTPDQKERKSFIEPSPSNTTPDLSSSPTEPSPASAQTATPSGSTQNVLAATEEKADGAAAADTPSAANTASEGSSTAQDQEGAPESVASGQIWRSGSKRGGWRRHQWSLDVG